MKLLTIICTLWLTWLVLVTREEVRGLRTDVQEAIMPPVLR